MLARYYDNDVVRFRGPDPAPDSALAEYPQTWNRYSYAVNNPLRFVDPTGELWTATGKGSYSWVDNCGKGQTCYSAVANIESGKLVLYGSTSAKDVTRLNPNAAGLIDLRQLSKQHDAQFQTKAGQPHMFLDMKLAAGFFNATLAYSQKYPGSQEFFVTEAGNAKGTPQPPHKTHDRGRAVDLRYQDGKGVNLTGPSAAANADVARTQFLVDTAAGAGFDQDYSARPKDFHTLYAPSHENHLHLGRHP